MYGVVGKDTCRLHYKSKNKDAAVSYIKLHRLELSEPTEIIEDIENRFFLISPGEKVFCGKCASSSHLHMYKTILEGDRWHETVKCSVCGVEGKNLSIRYGKWRAYHFVKSSRLSTYGREIIPFRIGESRTVYNQNGINLCRWGYHHSPTWLDAFSFGYGSVACKLLVSEPLYEESNLLVGRKRVSASKKILAMKNVYKELLEFTLEFLEYTLQDPGWGAIKNSLINKKFLDSKFMFSNPSSYHTLRGIYEVDFTETNTADYFNFRVVANEWSPSPWHLSQSVVKKLNTSNIKEAHKRLNKALESVR